MKKVVRMSCLKSASSLAVLTAAPNSPRDMNEGVGRLKPPSQSDCASRNRHRGLRQSSCRQEVSKNPFSPPLIGSREAPRDRGHASSHSCFWKVLEVRRPRSVEIGPTAAILECRGRAGLPVIVEKVQVDRPGHGSFDVRRRLRDDAGGVRPREIAWSKNRTLRPAVRSALLAARQGSNGQGRSGSRCSGLRAVAHPPKALLGECR